MLHKQPTEERKTKSLNLLRQGYRDTSPTGQVQMRSGDISSLPCVLWLALFREQCTARSLKESRLQHRQSIFCACQTKACRD